ncbi:hypothetical protein EDD21DRAFT_361011 [Dissophora ornata]|nr:hypothetical protein EDD21DRAFT_361011 [Dissophora ornata]
MSALVTFTFPDFQYLQALLLLTHSIRVIFAWEPNIQSRMKRQDIVAYMWRLLVRYSQWIRQAKGYRFLFCDRTELQRIIGTSMRGENYLHRLITLQAATKPHQALWHLPCHLWEGV